MQELEQRQKEKLKEKEKEKKRRAKLRKKAEKDRTVEEARQKKVQHPHCSFITFCTSSTECSCYLSLPTFRDVLYPASNRRDLFFLALGLEPSYILLS